MVVGKLDVSASSIAKYYNYNLKVRGHAFLYIVVFYTKYLNINPRNVDARADRFTIQSKLMILLKISSAPFVLKELEIQ